MAALQAFGKRFASERLVEQIRPEVTQLKPVPKPAESFTEYIRRVAPWYRIYRMTERLIAVLEYGYMNGGWLWINIPPRFGKTSLLNLFCAWVMTCDPLCDIGFCSYGQRLANKSSKAARDFYKLGGGILDDSTKAKVEWQTDAGGMMWAAGPAGQIRGAGYHIGIIDDLHKNSRELLSEVKVEAFQDFNDNTWMNRAQVHTHRPILRIYVGQRLGDNDIFGYMKGQADEIGDGNKWICVCEDAISREEPFPIPKGARLWENDRALGDNLEPLVLTDDVIKTNKADEDEWDAQFQQRPRKLAGTILNPSHFKIVTREMVPQMRLVVGGVDLAITTKNSSDYSVAFALGYGVDGRYYLYRPWRDKKESPDLRREIPAYCRSRHAYAIGVDSTAYQTSFVQELQADPLCAGMVILGVTSGSDKTDKQLLARSWSYLVEAGLVHLVEDETNWTGVFLKECRDFPRGAHDDQVDAAGYAFKMLIKIAGSDSETASSG